MINYPSFSNQAAGHIHIDPATVEIPYKSFPGSVFVSLRRWQFVCKAAELNTQGFSVDIDKIHRDGYNNFEDLPVIHQQLMTKQEDRLLTQQSKQIL